MADNDLVDVQRVPEPTLEAPSPASGLHHHHHDEKEEEEEDEQQNQACPPPSAAAFVAALPADSLVVVDDNDGDAFQEFGIRGTLVPMPVEGAEEAPKEQQEEEGQEEEGGLQLSGSLAALADQQESPLRKEEELASFTLVHDEQGLQALETSSSAPPASAVCPHVGQKGEGQEQEQEQEQELEEEEEKEIRVPLPHMELSSSREGEGGEAAAESSLAATEEKAGALLSFNPDLLLADMQYQSTMTWEEEGSGVPSLSPPGTFPLSAIKGQAAASLTGTMTTQDEAPETSSKDLPDDDDASGEFATLPAGNAAAATEAQEEAEKEGGEGHDALTLQLKGIAAAAPLPSLPASLPPAPLIEEEDVDDDEDDDFGDFAEAEFVSCAAASPLPAPDAAPLLPPTPPSTASPAHHLQASSSGAPSPLPSSGHLKLDARALFEESFGGPTVPVLSATKRRCALQELRMVDLQQGLCLNRPFQAGARPWSWSDDVLAKALRPSGSCTAHRRRHRKQQSPEEGEGARGEEEEEEEEEENAISIAWAIASPPPSRFNSISQGHVMAFMDESEKKSNIGKGADENEDEDEDEEEEEVMDEGFGRGSVLPAGTANQAMGVTPALSISSPSLPSELDFDFLAGGGGGGGGKEEKGWMPQQPQQMDGSLEGSALSRTFLQMGLGLPDEEAANSSMPRPATVKLSNATSRASIMPNKVPLSEEAQAVLSEAALPDFSYMLAKLPVAPPLKSIGSSNEQHFEQKE